MRYLISKSISVLILNICIAFFVTITFSNFIHAFQLSEVYQDHLSTDHLIFSIESSDDTQYRIHDIIGDIESQSDNMLMLRYNDNEICGVYDTRKQLKLKIISGRNFAVDDFQEKSNVVLVSNTYSDRCIEIDGVKKFLIGDDYYDVIGIYEYEDNPIHQNSYVYYNLNSTNMRNNQYSMSGQFAIDIGDKTDEIFDFLSKNYDVDLVFSGRNNTFFDRIKIAFFSQYVTIAPLLLVIIMTLLNTINVSFDWIDKRKKELIARKISGADKYSLIWLLVKDYTIIETISYILGFFMVLLVSQLKIKIFIGFDFSYITIVISFIVTLLIGVLSITLMVLCGNLKSITEQRSV